MSALTQTERRRLGALADILVPARDGMPAASEADVHGTGVDRVTALRPDLLAPVRRALAAGASVDDLRRDDPEAFAALTTLVAAAYLTEPARAGGCSATPGRPRCRRAARTRRCATCASSSRPVQARGSIWHATAPRPRRR